MSQTTALVSVPKSEAPLESATPFGRFVAALLPEQSQIHTMGGAAVWGQIPVEEVLSAGLWLILIKTAQKLDLPLATPQQVERINKRHLDRILNLGIELMYGTPEAAAEAFRSSVLEVVEKGMRLGFCPDHPPRLGAWKALQDGDEATFRRACQQAQKTPNVSVNAWQGPAALFFADILKQVNELHQEIEGKRRKLLRNNRLRKFPNISYFDLFNEHSLTTPGIIAWLDLGHAQGMEWLDWENDRPVAQLERIHKKLKHMLILRQTLGLLPIAERLAQVPQDILPAYDPDLEEDFSLYHRADAYVEEKWVNTMLLVEALGVKDRFHLSSPQEALRAIEILGEDSAHVIRRIADSLSRLDQRQRASLKQFLEKSARSLVGTSPESVLLSIFVYHTLENTKELSHKDALAFATGNASSVPAMWFEVASNKLWEFCEREVVPTIRWRDLSFKILKRIFRAHRIPTALTIAQLPHVQADLRQEIVEWLVAHAGDEMFLGDSVIGPLLEHSLLPVKQVLTSVHWREIPTLQIEQNLPDIFRELARPHERQRESDWFPRLVELVSNTRPFYAKQVLSNDPSLLEHIWTSIQAGALDTNESSGMVNEQLMAFAQRFYRKVWIRCVLADYLKFRMGAVEEPEEDEINEPLNRITLWEDPSGLDNLPHGEALHYVGSVKSILATYTEEDIFQWALANPFTDIPYDSWEEYTQKRDKFLPR